MIEFRRRLNRMKFSRSENLDEVFASGIFPSDTAHASQGIGLASRISGSELSEQASIQACKNEDTQP